MEWQKVLESWCLTNAHTWLGLHNLTRILISLLLDLGLPPSTGRIKINVDAHLNNGNGGSFGVVIRNDRGRLLAAEVKSVNANWSSEMAEAKSISLWVIVNSETGV